MTEISNDDAPRTPLTLEFVPEPIEGDTESSPIVICEPSLQHDGRIFLGAHPYGPRRTGNHMLPEDVRRLRDHLTKLLMESPEEPQGTVDWQERIRLAAERAAASKRRRGPVFQTQLKWGRFEAVFGRVNRD